MKDLNPNSNNEVDQNKLNRNKNFNPEREQNVVNNEFIDHNDANNLNDFKHQVPITPHQTEADLSQDKYDQQVVKIENGSPEDGFDDFNDNEIPDYEDDLEENDRDDGNINYEDLPEPDNYPLEDAENGATENDYDETGRSIDHRNK